MDNEGVKEIADLAFQAKGVQIIKIVEPTVRDGEISLAAYADGDGKIVLRSIKPELDAWRTAPERIKGTAKAGTLQSFIDLINRHKSDDSVVFAAIDVAAPRFSAVIDYHKIDHSPAFGVHRVDYAFPISPEWAAWQVQNAKIMTQGDWAAFIEEHVADLVAPLDAETSEYERLFQTSFALPTDMIQMSRGMQVAVEARVKEVRTLQSGEAEIVYEEVHKDGSGQKLVVPGLFIINIPLFVGGATQRIIARLRYRKQDSRIVWFYQMYRADLVVRAQLQDDLAEVADATGLPTFEASPEA